MTALDTFGQLAIMLLTFDVNTSVLSGRVHVFFHGCGMAATSLGPGFSFPQQPAAFQYRYQLPDDPTVGYEGPVTSARWSFDTGSFQAAPGRYTYSDGKPSGVNG